MDFNEKAIKNRNVLEVSQTLPKAPKSIEFCSASNGTMFLLLLLEAQL